MYHILLQQALLRLYHIGVHLSITKLYIYHTKFYQDIFKQNKARTIRCEPCCIVSLSYRSISPSSTRPAPEDTSSTGLGVTRGGVTTVGAGVGPPVGIEGYTGTGV